MKRPRLTTLRPMLKAADHRTVKPAERTFATRVAADPLLAFYSTPAWRKMRATIIAQRGPTCQTCGTPTDRPIVDHITEVRDGGARLDPANLRVLCHACHQRKTLKARAERLGLA